MTEVRVRKDVWKLAEWDAVLEWYARAVAAMRAREPRDPRSWQYQAAIHDFLPAGEPAGSLPVASEQRQFWRQCQHNTWFFLPWHRMYLACFEQIVATTVVSLGGPTGWTLPYWNYSDPSNPSARRLPPAFRASRLPDGADNPLLVRARNPWCNAGQVVADERDVDIAECLQDPMFSADPAGGNPGFGGPRTAFNHSGGVSGRIETTPHGSIHVAVGGGMGRFHTAALDPLFWLHHANVDRMWSVWARRNANHRNPTDQQWLTGVVFDFHDGAGAVVSFTPSQVVDTAAAPLSYRYEDESDPLSGGLEHARRETRRRDMNRIPEMLGATEAPVVLTGRAVQTRFSVWPATGPAATRLESGGTREMYLNIENITGGGDPISYMVYVNVPDGAAPQDHPELLAGVVPMFGVAEASRQDAEHPGSGLHYALEIGRVVEVLRERDAWDPQNVRVTFVPKRRGDEGSEGARLANTDPIRVGRVSLYAS